MKYFTLGLGAFALMIGLMVAPSAFAKEYPAASAATSNIVLTSGAAHNTNEVASASTVLAPTIDMIQPTNTLSIPAAPAVEVLSQSTAAVGIVYSTPSYPATTTFSTNVTPAITGSTSSNMNGNPAPTTLLEPGMRPELHLLIPFRKPERMRA
jgi:hypothetical protein